MKKKIKIAVYSRKSKYTLKGDSIGNQIELAMEYIKSHYPEEEYDVEVEVFEDEGFSGGTLDRPKFKRLIQEERIKPFDILICYRLDRISRNIADFSNFMNEITELGTSFVSIKEQFDTKTPMGRAMMYIASVFAQLEREVIAKRIRDNMIELAKTGRWLGGDAPIGYKRESYKVVDVYEESEDNVLEKKKKTACKLVDDEETLDLVRLIYSKYLELKSLAGVEKYLYRHEIKTQNDTYFTAGRIRAILSNPVKRFYYTCVKKEKSRGKKCQATNVPGILADTKLLETLKNVFVPNSEVYKELKKMTITKEIDDQEDELETLKKEYKKNTVEIKNLIDKLKYIDVSVVEYVNEELKNLKNKNEEIQKKIDKIESEDIIKQSESVQVKKGAELILDIIDNCFNTFESFDIKFKKDILRILIEEITGTKEELEVNLLNTKLEESRKRIFSDVVTKEVEEIEDITELSGEVSDELKKV